MDITQLEQAIERIAKMDHAGVSAEQIAQACNIDLAKLTELQETPKYKESLASVAADSFDKVDVLNAGWDVIENLAMNKVADQLNNGASPDFALRAAALANKAVRRGKHVNAPIGHTPNESAIINVNVQFAEKLSDDFVIDQRETKSLQKKANDFLAPKAVSKLLGDSAFLKKHNEQESISDEIGDMGNLVPAF